jgi:hypothetical protein
VAEAIDRLSKRVREAKQSNQQRLVVIVGRGLHSEGGPKIKPAVIDFAKQHRIEHNLNSPNAGCITFFFNKCQDVFDSSSLNRSTINSWSDGSNINSQRISRNVNSYPIRQSQAQFNRRAVSRTQRSSDESFGWFVLKAVAGLIWSGMKTVFNRLLEK